MTLFHDDLPQKALPQPAHLCTSVYSLVRFFDAFTDATMIPLWVDELGLARWGEANK